MKLTRDEQETIIRSSAAEDCWNIWTCDPRIIRLLQRRGYVAKPDHQTKGGVAVSVNVPIAHLTIRHAKGQRLSPEQRLKRANGLKFLDARREKIVSGSAREGMPGNGLMPPFLSTEPATADSCRTTPVD